MSTLLAFAAAILVPLLKWLLTTGSTSHELTYTKNGLDIAPRLERGAVVELPSRL